MSRDLESSLYPPFLMAASEAGHRLFRNNNGVAEMRDGSWIRFGVGGNGAPDLMGWCRDGIFAAVEVKRPGEALAKHQAGWILAARRANPTIRVGVAHSIAEMLAILDGSLFVVDRDKRIKRSIIMKQR